MPDRVLNNVGKPDAADALRVVPLRSKNSSLLPNVEMKARLKPRQYRRSVLAGEVEEICWKETEQ